MATDCRERQTEASSLRSKRIMVSRWMLINLCLIVTVTIVTADYGKSGPLVFSCPGNKDGIAFVEDKKPLSEVCGSGMVLEYNATMDPLSNGKAMFYFSSLPDPHHHGVHLMPTQMDMGSTNTGWMLTSPNVAIDQTDIPCGAGYIVVEVDNNGQKYMAAQRGVKTCDYSDIDVELDMDVTAPNYTITLYPGGDSLKNQLYQQGVMINKMEIRNRGNRRLNNVTMENPYGVMVFLRRRDEPETQYVGGCSSPCFKVNDVNLGGIMFTDGIEPHQAYQPEDDPMDDIHIKFDDSVTMCGDADLIVFLDPLGMLNDTNLCNNFKRFHVYIDCSMYARRDMCKVMSNAVMAGSEALMMFQDEHSHTPKIYRYMMDEHKWVGIDAHHPDRHTELVGLAKFGTVKKLLSHVYDEHYKDMFPCETVMDMIHNNDLFERIMGQSNFTLDSTRVAELSGLKSRLMNLNVMADNEALRYDIEQFGNDTSMYGMDEIMKSKIRGISFGMQMALGIKYSVAMAMMMQHRLPDNMTRTVLGPAFRDFSRTLHHISEQSPMMLQYIIPSMVQHAAMIHVLVQLDAFKIPQHIKMNVETIAENIMDFPEMVLDHTMKMNMCDRTPIAKMADYMRYLSAGHDGEMESQVDEKACSMLRVMAYMRHGGAYVVGKDIYDEVNKDMDDMHAPAECKQHPYIPKLMPPVIWHVDNGRIMKGCYSPLADKITWKVVAVCRCDRCPGDMYNDMYNGGSTTTSSWTWNGGNDQTTTYSGQSGG